MASKQERSIPQWVAQVFMALALAWGGYLGISTNDVKNEIVTLKAEVAELREVDDRIDDLKDSVTSVEEVQDDILEAIAAALRFEDNRKDRR